MKVQIKQINRCNESPLRGEKPDFWLVSKFNTGSLPLRGNPAGNNVLNSSKKLSICWYWALLLSLYDHTILLTRLSSWFGFQFHGTVINCFFSSYLSSRSFRVKCGSTLISPVINLHPSLRIAKRTCTLSYEHTGRVLRPSIVL